MTHLKARIGAVIVAVTGLVLFLGAITNGIVGRQSFTWSGTWWPFIIGGSGFILAGLGIVGFEKYRKAPRDVLHRLMLVRISREYLDYMSESVFWLLHWGSLAVGIGALILSFAVARESRLRFILFLGGSVFCGVVHWLVGRFRFGDTRAAQRERERQALEEMQAEDERWKESEGQYDPNMFSTNTDDSAH